MSNSDLTDKTNFAKNRNPGTQKLKDQVTAAGSEMKERAGTAVQASSDVARDTLQEATDAVKDLASGTLDQIQDRTREQQRSGADYVGRLAGNIRQAARAFESDVHFAARGINSAASYVEEAAAQIRNGSIRDVFDGVTDFAKRQPAAFLGMSVLAGFAMVRFLKANGRESSSSLDGDAWSGTSPRAAESWRQGSPRSSR